LFYNICEKISTCDDLVNLLLHVNCKKKRFYGFSRIKMTQIIVF